MKLTFLKKIEKNDLDSKYGQVILQGKDPSIEYEMKVYAKVAR